jgi:HEAT repeat protein
MSNTRKTIIFLLLGGIVVVALNTLNQESSKTNSVGEIGSLGQSNSSVQTDESRFQQPLAEPEASASEEVFPEEITEDDVQTEKELVDEAMRLLNSTKDEERVEGAELLATYPNSESEMILAQLLITDNDPDVRNAAAQSLGAVDVPLDSTIADLVNALEDEAEEVRLSALSTLQGYLLSQEKDTESYKKIDLALKNKASSDNIPADIRAAIDAFLKEQ